MKLEELKARLDEAIENGRPIKIRAYAILPDTEKSLSYIAENILDRYGRKDLLAPVYTALKELSINGAKANIKYVYFRELGIDMHSEDAYEDAMRNFKEEMSEKWVFDYATRARKLNLFVDIIFDYNPERLIIEVFNNRPITARENEVIRAKFRTAMQYDSIAEYYMAGVENSEGAGMGIVLVTMMLKAENIDPHAFTIRSNFRDMTIAKLEIPLSTSYLSSRQRYLEPAPVLN